MTLPDALEIITPSYLLLLLTVSAMYLPEDLRESRGGLSLRAGSAAAPPPPPAVARLSEPDPILSRAFEEGEVIYESSAVDALGAAALQPSMMIRDAVVVATRVCSDHVYAARNNRLGYLLSILRGKGPYERRGEAYGTTGRGLSACRAGVRRARATPPFGQPHSATLEAKARDVGARTPSQDITAR